jgi:hypothetical protein
MNSVYKKPALLILLLTFVIITQVQADAIDDFNRPNSLVLGTTSDGQNIWYERDAGTDNLVQVYNNQLYLNYGAVTNPGAALEDFYAVNGKIEVDFKGSASESAARLAGVCYRAATVEDAAELYSPGAYTVIIKTDWRASDEDVILYYGSTKLKGADMSDPNAVSDMHLKVEYAGPVHKITVSWSGGQGILTYIDPEETRNVAGYAGVGIHYASDVYFDNFEAQELEDDAYILAQDDFNRANSTTLGTMSDGINSWYEREGAQSSVQLFGNRILISYGSGIYAPGACVENTQIRDGVVNVRFLSATSQNPSRVFGVSYRADDLESACSLSSDNGYNVKISTDWSAAVDDLQLCYGTQVLASMNLSDTLEKPTLVDLYVEFVGNEHTVIVNWEGAQKVLRYSDVPERANLGYVGLGNYYTTYAGYDNFVLCEYLSADTIETLMVMDDFNRANSTDLGTMSDGVHSWYEMEAYASTNQIWSNKVFTSYSSATDYAAGASVDNFTMADGSVQVEYIQTVSSGPGRYVGLSYRAADQESAALLTSELGYNVRVAIDWSGSQDVSLYYGESLLASKNLTDDTVAPNCVIKASFTGNEHEITVSWASSVENLNFIDLASGRTSAGYIGFGNYYCTQAEFDNFAASAPVPAGDIAAAEGVVDIDDISALASQWLECSGTIPADVCN